MNSLNLGCNSKFYTSKYYSGQGLAIYSTYNSELWFQHRLIYVETKVCCSWHIWKLFGHFLTIRKFKWSVKLWPLKNSGFAFDRSIFWGNCVIKICIYTWEENIKMSLIKLISHQLIFNSGFKLGSSYIMFMRWLEWTKHLQYYPQQSAGLLTSN